jgi:hypothetical protein
MELGPEEWEEWKRHPVTKEILSLLQRKRAFLKEQWSNGNFTAQDQFGTAIANACAIGECKAYAWVLDLDVGEVNGAMSYEN